MSENFEVLGKIQMKVLKETKRTLESEKLSLWSYKADLNTIILKMKKIHNQIVESEETFYNYIEEARQASHEMEFTAELINTTICTAILEINSPWKILQDICGGICKMLGFTVVSWEKFQVICN